jgi:radical SAM-linked protein
MRLLVRYGKVGPARWASARDFARGFERALRRAQLPMAYSSGFSPHPRVSYVNPAATGVASQAEYVVVGLSRRGDPGEVAASLGPAMPAGFPILGVSELVGQAVFPASLWQIDLAGVGLGVVEAAVADFLAADRVIVSRQTRDSLRQFDARRPVEQLVVARRADPALWLVIRHAEPLVRPDDVWSALCALQGALPADRAITRLAQGEVAELVAPRAVADGGVRDRPGDTDILEHDHEVCPPGGVGPRPGRAGQRLRPSRGRWRR